MTEPAAVFFSYAREDSAFALRLAKDLRDAGHPVWLDQLDIPAGARWDTSVETALRGATTMLVILSPASVGSPNVMDEVSFAVEEGRRVIPILLTPCQIPFRLRRLQHVDFTGDYEAALKRALRDFPKRLSATITPITVEQVPEETAAPPPPPLAPTRKPVADAAPPARAQRTPQPAEPVAGGKRSIAKVLGGLVIVGVLATIAVKVLGPPDNQDTDPIEPTPMPVVAPPVAAFKVSQTSGTAPHSVQFSNESQGEISEYRWDFGDGAASSDRSPVHSFTAGDYSIVLTVRGPGGENISQSQRVSVQAGSVTPDAGEASGGGVNKVAGPVVAAAPRPNFESTQDREDAPAVARFRNLTTGQATAYEWDFGDGGTSRETSPSHRYAIAGSYVVQLKATGPGGTRSIRIGVLVKPRQSIGLAIDFGNSARSGPAPHTVSLRARADVPVSQFRWTFSDGTSMQGAEITKRFDRQGTFTVNLVATAEVGTYAADARVEVSAAAVQRVEVQITQSSPRSGPAPLTVRFAAGATFPVDQYAWDFGDGTRAAGQQATKTYDRVGTFRVTLRGAGNLGSVEAYTTIEVAPPAAPTLFDPRRMAGQYFKLQVNSRPNECLEGYKHTVGPARVMSCQDVTGQRWKWKALDAERFQMTTQWVEQEDLCLQSNRIDPANAHGGAAFMTNCGSFTGQIWTATPAGNGHYVLRAMAFTAEGLCLEGNASTPGAVLGGALHMAPCNGGPSQQWRLVGP